MNRGRSRSSRSGVPGLERHVASAARLASRRRALNSSGTAALGHPARTMAPGFVPQSPDARWPKLRSPRPCRSSRLSALRSLGASARSPVDLRPLRRPGALLVAKPLEVVSSGAIIAGAPPALDGHVATVMRPPSEALLIRPGPRTSTTCRSCRPTRAALRAQDQVLRDAKPSSPTRSGCASSGLPCNHALRLEHVLHASTSLVPDAEGQRAEARVRRGVRVLRTRSS